MDLRDERRSTVISIVATDIQRTGNANRKSGCIHSRYCRKTLQPYVLSYFALAAYVFIGAYVFQVLEAPHQKLVADGIDKARVLFFQNLRNGCNLTESNWSLVVEEQVSLFENELEKAFRQSMLVRKGYTWDYFASCFFCLTVVSTIGKVMVLSTVFACPNRHISMQENCIENAFSTKIICTENGKI